VGEAAALRLYQCFLRDLSVNLASDRYELGWYLTPADAWLELGLLVDPLPAASRVIAQPPGSWTDRQRWLFQTMSGRGEHRTILIASDSPQITRETIDDALLALEDHDVVLGPTFDGGYYLIGMRPPQAEHDVLRCVPMSTNTVLRDIAAQARAQKVSLALLEPTFDVDDASDLRQLAEAVRDRADLPWTRAGLECFVPAEVAVVTTP
jgi:2-phospho-L-lactate guanylyltransferase (CobY/MobA/RfbA family)